MSNLNEDPEFAAFCRMYRQFQSRDLHSEAVQPQQPAGFQNPQRAQQPRQSPTRIRPQPYRQPLVRNPPELWTFAQRLDDITQRLDELPQKFDEVKRRQDDTSTALNSLLNISEQIKVALEENMARMYGIIERFEAIGRRVLERALQSSNSQPPSGSSQPQASSNPPVLSQNTSQQQTSSNLSRPYGQGPNFPQPPTFIPSSNPSQLLYDAPPAQAPESYSDPYIEFGLDFLATDTS